VSDWPYNLIPERTRNMERRYGISVRDYVRLLFKQEAQCAVCNIRFTSKNKPYIDHCHISGEVRGLLCMKCNSGIGYLGDSIELLERSITYLKQGEANASSTISS
jgi:hypothetical protein